MEQNQNKPHLGAFGLTNPNPKLTAAATAAANRNQPPKPSLAEPTKLWLPLDFTLQGEIGFVDYVWSEKWQRWELLVCLANETGEYWSNRSPVTNQLIFRLGRKYQEWIGKKVSFVAGTLQ